MKTTFFVLGDANGGDHPHWIHLPNCLPKFLLQNLQIEFTMIHDVSATDGACGHLPVQGQSLKVMGSPHTYGEVTKLWVGLFQYFVTALSPYLLTTATLSCTGKTLVHPKELSISEMSSPFSRR